MDYREEVFSARWHLDARLNCFAIGWLDNIAVGKAQLRWRAHFVKKLSCAGRLADFANLTSGDCCDG